MTELNTTKRVWIALLSFPLFAVSLYVLLADFALLVFRHRMLHPFVGIVLWALVCWSSFRGVRNVVHPDLWPRKRISSVKISWGVGLISISLRNAIFPNDPQLHKAANMAQQVGMWLGALILIAVGAWLIQRGMNRKQPPKEVSSATA